jgi:hypothetical protein
MIEKFGDYEFEIFEDFVGSFTYKIYTYGMRVLRESNAKYDTEQEARFAAIGHIQLIESGDRQ